LAWTIGLRWRFELAQAYLMDRKLACWMERSCRTLPRCLPISAPESYPGRSTPPEISWPRKWREHTVGKSPAQNPWQLHFHALYIDHHLNEVDSTSSKGRIYHNTFFRTTHMRIRRLNRHPNPLSPSHSYDRPRRRPPVPFNLRAPPPAA
jgi:hypothetical protein